MFSVIMPVYNGAKFVGTAIRSVFEQTDGDWELLIVNDGSKDNTAEVLRAYEGNEKIRIFTQENAGVSAARNRAIAEAKGSHLVFLDADDVWNHDHLATMRALIEKYPNAGLYGTFTHAELQNGSEITDCHFFETHPDEVLLDDFFAAYFDDPSAKMFTVITTCVPTEAVKTAGMFPVGCAIGEDLEFSLRVAAYYPVVLSRKSTATYEKINSTATKDKSFDPDWGFFTTVEDLYRDERIPASKRESLRKLMQWFSMRRARHYLINGERTKAKDVFRTLDKRCIGGKDRAINAILMLLPTAAVRKIFAVRWRGKA